MTQPRLCAFLSLACSLVIAPPVCAAVADYIGKNVTTVRVEVESREVRDRQVLDLLETRVGAPLAMQQIRESITHLFSLGRYQDVQVFASTSAGGVAIRYDLIPLHTVQRIVFEGNLGMSERLLRRAVTDRYGISPPPGRGSDAAITLRDLYRDHGYMHAQVTPRVLVEHAPERSILIFEVKPGVQARIGAVAIEGRTIGSPEALLERLGVRTGAVYDRTVLADRLTKYVESLRTKGYYEAKADQDVRLTDDDRSVSLVLTITPGPLVTIAFEGDPLPAKELEALVSIKREGSVDEDILEDSSRRIEDFLRAQGYRDAKAPYRRESADGTLRIVFTVQRRPQFRAGRIEISGNASVALVDILPVTRLREGQPFVDARLDLDQRAITDLYHHRGFSEVKVQAEVVPNAAGALEAQRSLTVRLLIAEGVRTTIGTISFTGHSAVPEDVLRSAITAAPGSAFFVPDVARDREAVLQQYLNLGYQTASVDVVPAFSADKSRVDLRFTINEGPKALVDHLLIVGNNRTTTETIEREVLLKPGQPLSQEALVESRRRLAALGLFRRVNISELRHGSEIHRDVVVSVEEAPVTSVGYGGGLEGGLRAQRGADQGGRLVERLEFAPRGFFEIGRRNLWGKNRALNLFTRVTFHPQDQTTADPTSSAGFGFTEYRVLGTYREPKVLGTNADGLLTAAFEQAIRSSFNFSRRGTRAELARRLTPRVSVTGTYSLERTRLFDERFNQADKPLIDRLFPQVRLSSFSSSFVQDTRDDPVDPSRGSFLVLTGQLAARGIGSEVGFDKTFLQGFVYRQVPGSRRVVFAGGARLGFARGFPREVVRRDAMGHPVSGIDGQPIVDVVEDLPASERFFAGGDTTVRGFPLDQLGTAETIDQDGFPQGGHALVIFNAEMRIPVWHGIGLAGFLDAGNVFARVSDLDLGEIRGSVGVGLRYKSPVGPIRFDLGFKLDRRQFGTAPRESLTAFHVSLGQAF